MTDRIPTQGEHKGVCLHAGQSASRLRVVRADIDRALRLNDPAKLAAFAADPSRAPESRLLAAAKCEQAFTMATEARAVRPNIDLAIVRASVCGLDSLEWRSPTHYASDLDATELAVEREAPLPE